ncbi:uncharacterized protein LOC110840374, partial [Zootermopsis nevadensis]|uniref:uncharacterized protein LOC110840374 n=1 Tax=Zootermopsis nevadensis TaxID=136037 RepID=UPI000B8EBD8D
MDKNNVYIVGVSEVRWRDQGDFESGNYHMYYSGGESAERNVAIVMQKWIKKSVIKVQACSDRLMYIKLNAEPVDILIIQVYMPTSDHDDEEVEIIYEKIEEIIRTEGREKVQTIIMGDWNSVVGKGAENNIVGPHGLGIRNRRGDMMVDFCRRNGLVQEASQEILATARFQHAPGLPPAENTSAAKETLSTEEERKGKENMANKHQSVILLLCGIRESLDRQTHSWFSQTNGNQQKDQYEFSEGRGAELPSYSSDQTSQTGKNEAIGIEWEEESDCEQLDGHQPTLNETGLEVLAPSTSSNVRKSSQDPLLTILQLLQANKQENVKLAEQLTPTIREVKQDFRNATQKLSDKFEGKMQKDSKDLNNRSGKLEKTVANKTKKLSEDIVTVQHDLNGSVENVPQEVNQFRQEVTEERHSLKENTGEKMNRLNSRLEGLERATENKVANLNVQQMTPGYNPPASNEAVDNSSLRHENQRSIEELHVACESSVPCVNASYVRESACSNINFGTSPAISDHASTVGYLADLHPCFW